MSNCAGNADGCSSTSNGKGDFAGQPDTTEKHILTIAVVAQMFKISKLALRLFEWRGMIKRQQSGNQRVYSWFDCERIALLVKGRKAGLMTGQLSPVLKAMDEQASKPVIDCGRLKCLSLIHELEREQQAIGNVLGELYRIDWELSDRLGVKDSGGPPS